MKKPTIYEIKRLTKDKAPYFFSRDTMRFFGQTLKDFKVGSFKDGRFKITAKSWGGNETVRYFNPKTNDLEY
tara:strand:- start:1608 stop:1823 length:216 start_codon:yes stop_codon:yes gene_type:complete